jgi:23S rRNA (uracil1939-C5)-methyltransferase
MLAGDTVTLQIERPAVGGRMLARHEGRVMLVSGAIPGERVVARLEQARGQVGFAATVDVLEPSPDRRPLGGRDPSCGGGMLAHVTYERQLSLKHEIVADAFRRIARLPPPSVSVTHPSPERGYRMRARLHVQQSRVGFYREGTHQLCDAETTGQLTSTALAVVGDVADRLQRLRLVTGRTLELTESRSGDQRVIALSLPDVGTHEGQVAEFVAPLAGCTGLAVIAAGRRVASSGQLAVADAVTLHDKTGAPSASVTLQRTVGAFFQANRFLLEALANRVTACIERSPVADLYAGCGLFGLSAASVGRTPVIMVEGDRVSCQDLTTNAAPFAEQVSVRRQAVERFLASGPSAGTAVIDPPRTGLSKEAAAGLLAMGASRIVYVSCDVATLARDARVLTAGGYGINTVELFDLFPNTAHIESLAVFDRQRRG